MKDVQSCDKLRGAAKRQRSGDFRMGQPLRRHGRKRHDEFNSRERAYPVN